MFARLFPSFARLFLDGLFTDWFTGFLADGCFWYDCDCGFYGHSCSILPVTPVIVVHLQRTNCVLQAQSPVPVMGAKPGASPVLGYPAFRRKDRAGQLASHAAGTAFGPPTCITRPIGNVATMKEHHERGMQLHRASCQWRGEACSVRAGTCVGRRLAKRGCRIVRVPYLSAYLSMIYLKSIYLVEQIDRRQILVRF